MFDSWSLLPGAETPDETDHQVMRWLSSLHVLTTGQVARLCLTDGRSPTAARRAAQRRLARLHRLDLVERLEHALRASTELAWRLTPAGMQMADPATPTWRRREPSLSRLAHVHDVAELVVRLHETARHGAFQVTDVQGEPACWRPYTISPYGQRRLLKPDLRLTIDTPSWRLFWFIELDRGTEHRPVLRRKIAAYLTARRMGVEHRETGTFPRVLWIAPDKRRVTVIEDLCREPPDAPDGLFVTATPNAAVKLLALI